ncbi:hypothetical protein N9891_01530 [bacterium]|nr:hypothetical protein [bacterium]
MAKRKAKRYTPAEKKDILDYITAQGRGGLTKAVQKFKVTAATVSSWRKKVSESGSNVSGSKVNRGASKELKALQDLTNLLSEIETTERKLAELQKRYAKAKGKL